MSGVRVTLEMEDNLPSVSFDPDALSVIVQNLLDNAEKHTRAATNRDILVALQSRGDAAALSVRDRGPGVPKPLRRRLFRPFVRGDQPDAPAGLGLGLAMARALAEAHHGTLTHAETPGGGATFTALFPAT